MDFFNDMMTRGAIVETPEEIERKRRESVLVKTRKKIGGTLTNNVSPGDDPIDRYRTMGADLMSRADDLDAAPADYSAYQRLARQNKDTAESSMLNALAAQFAGESFQPIQAQFLKKAMDAQKPVNIGNYGYVGNDGEVVIDPTYQREKTIDNLRRRAIQLETLATNAETQRERIAAQQAQQSIMNEIRMMNAQTQRMMVEGRYGTGNEPTNQYPTSGASAQPEIMSGNVNPSEALGLSGKWQNFWNTAADAVGMGDPNAPNKIATARMDSLANQTQLYLQDAVPGRPSNYLLQMLEKQAIRPNQVTLGEGGAKQRAEATLAVIATGLEDNARILNNPRAYSPKDVADAQAGYSRLSKLKAEYDSFLGRLDSSDQVAELSPEGEAALRKYLGR